ncbi:MAG: protein translocase subunit SecD [Chloroflexi bacterium]|nr:MAG: protein translocase subunit SecD [Chloroflexota bacterium]
MLPLGKEVELRERNLLTLLGIILLVAFCVWVDLPNNPGIHIRLGPLKIDREIKIRQGLDLQGGLHVVLEADVPPDEPLPPESMEAARAIVQNRVDGMGVVEATVQLQGERRIIVELPGIEDPAEAIKTIKGTGLLEFVETGDLYIPEGVKIRTTYGTGVTATETLTATVSPTATAAITATPAITATETLTPTGEITPTEEISPTSPFAGRVFKTIMTGKHLKSARVGTDEYGRPEIDFELTPEGARIFAQYTREHVGDFLAIVMDKRVISCPRIQSPITQGRGRITSEKGFPLEEARRIAIQLQYGALPVPLRVLETRMVGPTLGQDSVRRSIRAGIIGLIVVLAFMLTYYRLPGFLADLALISYGLINMAIYKFGIPGLFSGVTLTLPGITGFILSTGMAVDANILIFERMKEELRWGRPLSVAIEAGFNRAWTSIRDSNLSTLLTCVILYWFGSSFGASMVKGFAITLFIGVCISMFTAITMTRTFISIVFDLARDFIERHRWLLGI